ncbi:MAG: hypothetical protein ACI9MC_000466 [Kiritimatiellia bacterium]|jgi:hypothetical protein
MWLVLLAGLALAQDPDSDQQRLLGPEPSNDVAAHAHADSMATSLPLVSADVAPAHTPAPLLAQRPAPAPAQQVMKTPINTGFIWSLAWPIGLVIGAGGLVWWARKKGIKIPGISKGGFAAFSIEGPSIQVLTRTTVGTNTLAVLEVSQDGSPSRRLLVSLGPSSSTLLADLDARPGVSIVQQPAPTAVNWTEPTSTAVAPVPAVVGAPVIAAVAKATRTPTIAQQTVQSARFNDVDPQDVQFGDGPTSMAQPTHSNSPQAPEVAIRFDDQLDHELSDPGPRPAQRPAQRPTDPEPRSALQGRRSNRANSRATNRDIDEDPTLKRRSDWRSATYNSAQSPIDDELDGLTAPEDERPARTRRSPPQRGRQTPRAWDDEPPTRERRAPRKNTGHLSALAGRNAEANSARKSGRSPIRHAANRQERTEAARALLEQVMSRRRAGGDRR